MQPALGAGHRKVSPSGWPVCSDVLPVRQSGMVASGRCRPVARHSIDMETVMNIITADTGAPRALTPEDAAMVSGGILEVIEKGDEFMTIRDHIIRAINEHPILWDPLGTGWNKYPS